MTPRNLSFVLITFLVSLVCYERAETNRFATPLGLSIRLIEKNYVEPVDSRRLFEAAMNGIIGSLDDPYSEYIPPDRKQRFDESLEGEFGGVGIVVDPNTKLNCLTVLSPIVGTPAYRAGLRAGDSILEIDGKTTAGMAINDAVRLMRGRIGSQVVLTIKHPGETDSQQVPLTRAVIRIDSVLGDGRRPDGSWDFFLEENPRLQYLRINTFGEHTAEELRTALESTAVQGRRAEGVILDLRNNAGGLLKSAIEVCDMFLDEGVIVSTRGRDGADKEEFRARKGMVIGADVPIAVLVNGYSASASEILAACLQDHRRAVVVGERTWGKGTVQNVIPFEGGRSALRLTTATYWRPSNQNIHRSKTAKEDDEWGVRPSDGMSVAMDVELAKQVLRYRRFRDVFHVGDEPELESTPESNPAPEGETGSSENGKVNEKNDEESTPPPKVDDPQLRRAIEYLEGKLSTPQAA